MDVNERLEKMLIRYLEAEKGIEAVSAYFGDTEGPYDDGCSTCGYGSTGRSFEIMYRTVDARYASCLDIEGDPLNFFPTLLEYDTED